MILGDTLSQPYALLICSAIGAAFGLLYSLNWFVCAFLIKSAFYRHISQILYALTYGICFFYCILNKFEYNLHFYHILISLFASVAIGLAINMPIMKYRKNIKRKCDALIRKISQSKFAKRIKK